MATLNGPMAEAPIPDPREAWSSPYRGIEFGTSFKWLSLGALLYALLLLVAMAGKPTEATYPIIGPSLYLTPMFGLPYVLATINRPGRTRRMLFFLILLPLIHVAANYLAWRHAVANFDELSGGRDFVQNLAAGALGGLAGSALSFGVLEAVHLVPPRRFDRMIMVFGVLALTAVAAAATALGIVWTDALHEPREISRTIVWFETIHAPWQLLFGFYLAWLMRRPRPPRPKRARLPRVGAD